MWDRQGAGTPDPYACVVVGRSEEERGQWLCSDHLLDTFEPRWDSPIRVILRRGETTEFLVYDGDGDSDQYGFG